MRFMLPVLPLLLLPLLLGLLALAVLLALDRRAERLEWDRLAALQPQAPERFSVERLADLPEPARRYFTYPIQPDAPLWRVTEIDMGGRFSLGTRENPAYRPMEARQIIAVPDGFLWAMRTRGRSGDLVAGRAAAWARHHLAGGRCQHRARHGTAR